MAKEYCNEFIKLLMLIFLFTLPLLSLIYGFDEFYAEYEEVTQDSNFNMVPLEALELNQYAPFENGKSLYLKQGTASVRYHKYGSGNKSGIRLENYLTNFIKREHTTAKAEFTAGQLFYYPENIAIEKLEVGSLKLSIPSGHFDLKSLDLTVLLMFQKYGDKLICKSDLLEMTEGADVDCNLDFDFVRNKVNMFKLTVYSHRDNFSDKILSIDYHDNAEFIKPDTTIPTLLYFIILFLWCAFCVNQIPRFGPDFNEMFITDRLTVILFVYLLMIKMKDLLILSYYLKHDESLTLYVIYLGIGFLTWIEIISACLILEYYLSKTINTIQSPELYYLIYSGIYVGIIAFSAGMGYYFDVIYQITIYVTNDALLYGQNLIWVPLIFSNILMKKRGLLDSSISIAISIKSCLTLNYYTLLNGKYDSLYEGFNEMCDIATIHLALISFLQVQRIYGSWFMCPKKYRTLKHQYLRQLHLEYSPKELSDLSIHECDFCMFPIHRTGFYDDLMRFKDYDRVRDINGLHAITPCDHIFHYACLFENMRKRKVCPKCNINLPKFDEFND